MSACKICGKWNGAHATLPGQSTDHLCHGHALPTTANSAGRKDQPLEEVASLLRVLLASSTEIVDDGGDVVGYQIKTGALHRILGLLSAAGHPVTIPRRLPHINRAALAQVPEQVAGDKRLKEGAAKFLAFHPQASHVRPDYRDGWNDCFKAASAFAPPIEPTEVKP